MITIIEDHCGGVSTLGLAASVGFELVLPSVRRPLRATAARLIEYLAMYFTTERRALVDGETIDWSSSLLRARELDPGRIALDEFDYDGTTILAGVNNALEIWDAQTSICRANHVELNPTPFGSKMAISPGALEHDVPLEGIRYHADGTMSGWWLFAPDYNGQFDNFKSMAPTHTFHVLQARRDVARYLGLPAGYAFNMTNQEIWRDTDAVP